MATGKLNRYWTPIIIVLLVIIAISSVVAWSKYSGSRRIEISMPPAQELQGDIYVGGTVNNPGFYPLLTGDSIQDIIQAAGGTSDSADLSKLELYIPQSGGEEEQQPQKIDINHAEAWLLQSLPGIGEVRAQAIIDYRQQNERFHSTDELVAVDGVTKRCFVQCLSEPTNLFRDTFFHFHEVVPINL
ncbi:helix-hairpin-helix domain-containing protein [Chloroflexota bacterium]